MIPSIIALDFETGLVDGGASVEYYRPDFRILSMAISWYDEDGQIKNHFDEGEHMIQKTLQRLMNSQIPIVVHNLQFEYGVLLYRFPNIQLNWHADTMRLVQVGDNGGSSKNDKGRTLKDDIRGQPGYKTGLSLQASISRWLDPSFHNHKEPFYKYLRDTHGVKAGKEGSNLHLLPNFMLRDYNTADTDTTLRLYTRLTDRFHKEKYDWTLDHGLYMSSARMIAESRGKGIKVDLKALSFNLEAVDLEIAEIWEGFLERFRIEIRSLEEANLNQYVGLRSTERGQASARQRAMEKPELYQFNLNSTKQKARLFVELLGLTPKYFTPKGKPAFGKQFLKQWGPGGEMLAKRGTLQIAQRQMINLIELSQYDSYYHVDLRAAGTKTGRYKGGRNE